MCGIVGFISRLGRKTLDVKRLTEMRDTMIHRGPDDAGVRLFEDGKVGLAHRRLSIIDLSSAGREPMSSRDGRYWLTFNGEIYNFSDLRSELISKGYDFRSSCDAEVILASYSEWGTECVKRFNGMWAFAIWDTKLKTLFCSRDRFGIKPFYYYDNGDLFIFASEIRAILASGCASQQPCLESVAAYLDSGIVDGLETTFFEGIFRLKPARCLLISEGGTKLWRYWNLEVAPRDAEMSSTDVARVEESFEEAVRSHMVSDVPLGLSLSGGLDSSSIFAVASRIRKDRFSVFSSYFEDGDKYDERYYFNKVADEYGAEKYSVLPDKNQLLDILPKIIWHLEEPPLAHGVYPRWHIMELASNHVKVLLVGQGGDEIFAGYENYYWYFLRDCLAQRSSLRFYRELLAMFGRNFSLASLSIFRRIQHLLGYQGFHRMKGKAGHHPLSAFSAAGERLSEIGSERGAWERSTRRGDSWLNEKLYYDATYSLLPTLLKYDDKIGMAFSVECRVPFLDHRLVELVFSLSPFVKIRNGWTKYILRQAMNGILPPAVQWRPDKAVFPMPFSEWLKGRLLSEAEERILDGKLTHNGYLDRTRLKVLLKAHREHRYDLSRPIWKWLCLSIWFEVHTQLTNRSLAARSRYFHPTPA
jgi:asparagine synthase (glutamine-hydrolysing)